MCYLFTADQQQSSRLMSFVGSNCLLQLPSSTKQTKVDTNTIVDVILIKSIENTYIAPVLQNYDCTVKVNSLLLFVSC